MREAYIVAGYRTAVTKSKKGGFRFTRPDDLAITLIRELIRSVPALTDQVVDDVIVGNAVPEAEQGLQVGRIIAARALGIQTPGMTVNRYCASGLETIAIATAKIRSGMADIIVAGGVESMSMVPASGWKTVPSFDIAQSEPDYYLNMGLTAEAVAKEFNVSRADQDAFSLRSHQRALQAIELGHFRSGILPIPVEEVYLDERGKKQKRQFVVDTDEGPRADTSLDALAKLKPAFSPVGTVTAGNASQTSDGAAFAVLMSWFPDSDNIWTKDLKGFGSISVDGAVVLSIAFLSMAGIPLTAGFFGKLYMFVPAMKGGLYHLLIVGIVSSVIGASYYLRPVMNVWSKAEKSLNVSASIPWLAYFCLLLILIGGVFPDTLVEILSAI